MAKFFKTLDGILYKNVTPHAHELFHHMELFVLWEKGDTTYRLPIDSLQELKYAIGQQGKYICIEVGTLEELSKFVSMKSFKWDKADTITHEGFIYVKYNDLLD